MLRQFRLAGAAFASALFLSACSGDGAGPEPAAVASIAVQPDSTSLAPGGTVQLNATLRDAQGNVLGGRAVTWSSSDRARADVSGGGLVSGGTPGRVVITATSGNRSGQAVVHVNTPAAGGNDFAIVGAQFTQGVQAADGSIPMLLGGSDAVVNVLISARDAGATPMEVVLRLYDAAIHALVHTDTVRTQGTLGSAPGYFAPTVQFLVPAAVLRAGLEWQVVRDPRGVLPDDSAANDVFPRTGRAPLAVIAVPPLRVRFVPIVLAAHSNATGAVSEATLPEYMRTARSVLPIGATDVRIGTPLTTSASFGVAPSGGQQAFWVQVLGELDLARLLDTQNSDAHWYGVVRPPPGFNFTQFGGFGYVPASATSIGAGTRTAVGVQVGWFTNPTQARDLVAHELGHNFGRRHSPCGNAGAPLDTAYPIGGGLLDVPGHDVYAWQRLGATRANPISTGTGDVMGYCFPAWASTYTYRGVLQFRAGAMAGTAGMAGTSASAVSRVLVVRGSVSERGVTLDPAFSLDARPSAPEGNGSWVVEGMSLAGRVLFSHAFRPAELDHAPDLRTFLVAVPLSGEIEGALHALRVRGAAGETLRLREGAGVAAGGAAVEGLSGAAGVALEAAPGGTVRVRCPAHAARGVAVQDGATGALLGTANAAAVEVAGARGALLAVTCSDGVRSERFEVRVQ